MTDDEINRHRADVEERLRQHIRAMADRAARWQARPSWWRPFARRRFDRRMRVAAVVQGLLL